MGRPDGGSGWDRLVLLALVLLAVRLAVYAALAHGDATRAMCQWDCDWYLSTAEHGYDAVRRAGPNGFANWAFFPLLPLAIRALHELSGLSPLLAGLAISQTALLGFMLLGARYRAITRPGSREADFLLLVAVWPYGIYFSSVYTESLYALLTILALLLREQRREVGAAAACGLLSATRPTGVLLSAALGVVALLRVWRARRLDGRTLLVLVLAPLGLVLFMAWLWHRTGDPLAFAHIQAGWLRQRGNPLRVLYAGFANMDFRHRHLGTGYEAGWGVLGLLAGGWLAWRGRWIEGWLCAATVVMALSSGALTSLPRFVAAGPVFLLAAADFYERLPHRLARLLVLAGLAVLQIVFLGYWYRAALFLT